MNEKCFEQGDIQAFIDGEASPALSFAITSHAAACDNCAILIAQAEEESAQVFALLDREMNTLVPTQRLWTSINAAIAEEKDHTSIWDKVRGFVLTAFASPSIAVAASVLLVFGIFAAVWTLRSPVANIPNEVAKTVPQDRPTQTERVTITGPDTIGPGHSAPLPESTTVQRASVNAERPAVRNADLRPERRTQRLVQNAVYHPPVTAFPEADDAGMPGEDSYVRTIASLKENVDARKDVIMSPSTRVAFERDLAVVDDSIKKMKNVVAKDPKNQAAKQVLYSSYQNKIDLLNSVVERGELMASLQ